MTRGSSARRDGEVLYNGILLPSQWPPRDVKLADRAPPAVPYLDHPPAVIPIDIGRQLFVDDFLIESTTLGRTYHHAEKYEKNPIISPETETETAAGVAQWTHYAGSHIATLFNDGCWFDPADRTFKLFYMTGWHGGTALAYSKDGLHWERPDLGGGRASPNQILPEPYGVERNGNSVWLDLGGPAAERWKMFMYHQGSGAQRIYTSCDGVYWRTCGEVAGVGDNTSMFYNPFRRKWVYSIRIMVPFAGAPKAAMRCRAYRECDDLVSGAARSGEEMVHWAGADDLDRPDPWVLGLMSRNEAGDPAAERQYGNPTQLYNLDAVAYESLMLGVFNVHFGPDNHVCQTMKIPKVTKLELAYSRDGFHWSRPDRTPFIAPTLKEGDWDRAYLHPASSICNIVGDRLHFYYGGFSGRGRTGTGFYDGGAIGVAFLRRDGFASMDADARGGTLTTRKLRFRGRHCFVNVETPQGELRVEVLDGAGRVVAPFSVEGCVPVKVDRTRQRISWRGAADLSAVAGNPVRLRFHLTKGRLYAFWITPDPNGASYGYVAAGGPGYGGAADVPSPKTA